MVIWQAATVIFLGVTSGHAAEGSRFFQWDPPKVTRSLFTSELGLLDTERQEYATNLASEAAKQVVAAKAAPQSLVEARHMIALALHLSLRNKRAIVVNYQLTKGLLPEVVETSYSPQVFSRLLLSRGQLLEKQGGDENKRLARLFVQLATDLDPRNEDAVYASEVYRLDGNVVDWSVITDGVDKPATGTAPEKKPETKEPDQPASGMDPPKPPAGKETTKPPAVKEPAAPASPGFRPHS